MHTSRLRSVAQPGSALVWGTSGRGFESRRSDQFIHTNSISCMPVFLKVYQVLF